MNGIRAEKCQFAGSTVDGADTFQQHALAIHQADDASQRFLNSFSQRAAPSRQLVFSLGQMAASFFQNTTCLGGFPVALVGRSLFLDESAKISGGFPQGLKGRPQSWDEPSQALGDSYHPSGGTSRTSKDSARSAGESSRPSGGIFQASGGPYQLSRGPYRSSGGPSQPSGEPYQPSGGPYRSWGGPSQPSRGRTLSLKTPAQGGDGPFSCS